MISLGALLGSQASSNAHAAGSRLPPAIQKHGPFAPEKHASGVDQAQKMLSERLSQRLADKLDNAAGAQPAAVGGNADQDFSPAKVSERILGFIEKRLKDEKSAGASDEVLQQRYQQALDGVRKGMEEARQELEKRGIFEGDVRDNYFDTFGRVQQGLDDLKDKVLGAKPSTDANVEATGRTAALATQSVAVSESRQFDMEVKTQDGDVVRINVNSARDFSAMTAQMQTDGMDAEAFSSEYAEQNGFSFEVEGELDEGELKALNDLFSQVNDVADTFYGGDVEGAFNQALSIGYDKAELAGFAANMTHSQSVTVTQAYAEVAKAGGGTVAAPKNNLMSALADFAKQAREAEKTLKSSFDTLLNGNDLFRELLSRLPAHNDAQAESQTSHSEAPWKQFIEGVLAPAA